jgi:hypothetical protein
LKSRPLRRRQHTALEILMLGTEPIDLGDDRGIAPRLFAVRGAQHWCEIPPSVFAAKRVQHDVILVK